MKLASDVLKLTMAVCSEKLSHFEFVIGAGSSGSRLRGSGRSGHGIAILVVITVEHLAVSFGETCVDGNVLLGGKRVSCHGMLLLLIRDVVMMRMSHAGSHGPVHREFVVCRLHMGGSLEDHIFWRHLRAGAHVLSMTMVIWNPLTSVHG